jgi:3-hydroxybutyrate dehydrogenase
MEIHTALVLTVQLVALFSIAFSLLLYLLCKVKGSRNVTLDPRCGSILITSADTALGLQLSTYLASKGCRVFAGMKDPHDSLPAKLLKGWMKARENHMELEQDCVIGQIVPLKIDVTKEDVLREATEKMGAHLNAGERGILAVVNTAGTVFRGRIDTQEFQEWASFSFEMESSRKYLMLGIFVGKHVQKQRSRLSESRTCFHRFIATNAVSFH